MSKLVEFKKDTYPYCKGDVRRLTDEELKNVKADTYVEVKEAKAPTTGKTSKSKK